MKKMKIIVATYLVPDEYYPNGFRIAYSVRPVEDGPCREGYMEDYGWVELSQEVVEVEEPDYDIREVLLKGLKAEEKKLVAEYAKSKASIEDRVSKLMALEVLS